VTASGLARARLQWPYGRRAKVNQALLANTPPIHASKPWPHQQIDSEVTAGMRIELAVMLRRAAIVYKEPRYENMIKAVAGPAWESNRVQLSWPAQRY
jgi:hypothetical protein